MARTARQALVSGSMLCFLALVVVTTVAAQSSRPGPDAAPAITSRPLGAAPAPGARVQVESARFDDAAASPGLPLTADPAFIDWSEARAALPPLLLAAVFAAILCFVNWEPRSPVRARIKRRRM